MFKSILGLFYSFFLFILNVDAKCSDPFCKTCPNDPVCTSCTNSFYLKTEGVCVSSCPLEYYSVVNEGGLFCFKCPEYCTVCSVVQTLTCTQCAAGKYLQNSVCQSQCSWNYFSTASYNFYTCIACDPGCSSCVESGFCLKCNGYYFETKFGEKYLCSKKCEIGLLYDSATSSCKPCPRNCENCYETSKCDRCKEGYQRSLDALCELSCNPNSYYDRTLDTCVACSNKINSCSNCIYSQDLNKLLCVACAPPNILFSGKCLSSCPDGTVAGNNTCLPCLNSKCKNCEAPPSARCLNCISGAYFLDNVCYEKCPEYYLGDTDFLCKECIAGCRTCKDLVGCVYCDITNTLNFNSKLCEARCPSGQYMVDFFLYRNCFNCKVSNCDVCTSSDPVCQSCKQGSFYYQPSNDQGYCQSTCPDGYFTNLYGKTCDPCLVENCLKCTISSSLCDQCSGEFMLAINKKTCSKSCSLGSVASSSGNVCLACPAYCETCQQVNINFCSSCQASYYLFNSTCQSTCPNKYIGTGRICEKCLEGCEKCLNVKSCLICSLGFYLLSINQNCLTREQTPTGYYAEDKNRTFVPCFDINCEDCRESATYCKRCNAKTLLNTYLNSCVASCGANYFTDRNTMKCFICSSLIRNCSECSSPTTCNSCMKDYFLTGDGSACLEKSQTPPGNFPDPTKGKFIPCSIPLCANCIDDVSTCKKCQTNFYLNLGADGKCYENCPPTYFNDIASGICALCERAIPFCLNCTNNTICTKCKSDYFLLLNNQTKCFTADSVPEGFYPDISSGFFVKCASENCKNCLGEKFSCVTCFENFYLLSENKSCLSSCPISHYKENNPKKCTICDSAIENCESCESKQTCIKCKPGYFLTNDSITCLLPSDTPPGYFPDPTKGKFIPCSIPLCANCIDDVSTCKKCQTNFYLNREADQKCIKNCPPTYFNDISNGICALCERAIPFCLNCTNNTICTKCKSDYFLLANNQTKCFTADSVPEGFYPDISSGYFVKCASENCKNCLGEKFSCVECFENYYLLFENKSCLSSCPISHYKENNLKKCALCRSAIANCESCESKLTCIKCESGYFLTNDSLTCLPASNTPLGFFADPNIGKFIPCETANCTNCSTDSKICQSCKSPLFLLSNKSRCARQCEAGQYADAFLCQNCDRAITNCFECANKSICSKCFKGKLLAPAYKSCLESNSSLPGFYPDEVSGRFIPCGVEFCSNCSESVAKCSYCKPNYYLLSENQTCLASCPQEGFYDYNFICKKCLDSNCKSCNGFQKNGICDLCADNYYLSETSQCHLICGAGRYLSLAYNLLGEVSKQTCLECPSRCVSCHKDGCYSCQEGFRLEKNKCLRICNSTDWLSQESNTCLPCESGCSRCSGPSLCDKCKNDLFTLNSGVCSCAGPGLRYEDGKCERCETKNCISCSKASNSCDECDPGFYLDSEVCAKCSTKDCRRCSSSSCSECEEGKFLLFFRPNRSTECLSLRECPLGYYQNGEQTCFPCSGNCKKCKENGVCIDEEEIKKNGPLEMKIETLPFSSNIVELKFNRDLRENDSYKYFNISLANMASEKYQLQVNQTDSRTIKIEILYKISVAEKILNVTLKNNSLVVDQNGIGLGAPGNEQTNFKASLYPFTIYSNETKNEVQAIRTAGSTTSSGIIFVVWPFQVVKSFAIFWLLIDAMQISNFFLFMNVNYPLNLQTFFEILSNSNLEFLQTFFFPVHVNKKKEEGPLGMQIIDQKAPKQFDRRNLSTLFFSNGLVYFIVIPILGFLLISLRKSTQISSAKPGIRVILLKLRGAFEYSLVIRVHQIIFLDLCLASLLQMRNFSSANATNIVSFFLATGVCIYLVVFFYKLFKIVNSRSEFYLSDEYEKKFSILYEDYRLLSFFHRNYSLFILLKKFLTVFFLVFLHDFPYFVISLIGLLYFINFLMLAKSKPFEKSYFNLLNATAELLLVTTLACIFMLSVIDHQYGDEIPDDVVEKKLKIGWAAVVLCSAVLFFYLLSFFIELSFIVKNIGSILIKLAKKNKELPLDKTRELVTLENDTTTEGDSSQSSKIGARALEKFNTWSRENSLSTLNTEKDESPKKLHRPDQRSQWANLKSLI